MENLIRLVYCQEKNLSGEHLGYKNGKCIQELKIPEPNEVLKTLRKYIEEIKNKNDEGIILGYCFNLQNWRYTGEEIIRPKLKKVIQHFEPEDYLLFPFNGEIKYKIKKGDFWVKPFGDPIEIKNFLHISFYSRNPFDEANLEKYNLQNIKEKIEETFLN